MKRFTTKRAQLERLYLKVLDELKRERDYSFCDGCLLNVPVTPSHLIPRGYDITKLADPENIHFHCQRCADLCETGEWHKLVDGKKIAEYIHRTDYAYFKIKEMAHYQRHGRKFDLL